jgi:(1->4)-alpha-D-glucan 1-alpha-D-glucosylmutase
VSRYAEFFDIDWNPPDATLHNKILLPFLGAPYGDVLDANELVLKLNPASSTLYVEYHEHHFPISSRSAALVLHSVAEANEISHAFADAGKQTNRHAARNALQKASAACMSCCSASTIAWPGGAPRRTRSTGGDFSTSTRSPASVSRCRGCSTPRMNSSSGSTPRG